MADRTELQERAAEGFNAAILSEMTQVYISSGIMMLLAAGALLNAGILLYQHYTSTAGTQPAIPIVQEPSDGGVFWLAILGCALLAVLFWVLLANRQSEEAHKRLIRKASEDYYKARISILNEGSPFFKIKQTLKEFGYAITDKFGGVIIYPTLSARQKMHTRFGSSVWAGMQELLVPKIGENVFFEMYSFACENQGKSIPYGHLYLTDATWMKLRSELLVGGPEHVVKALARPNETPAILFDEQENRIAEWLIETLQSEDPSVLVMTDNNQPLKHHTIIHHAGLLDVNANDLLAGGTLKQRQSWFDRVVKDDWHVEISSADLPETTTIAELAQLIAAATKPS